METDFLVPLNVVPVRAEEGTVRIRTWNMDGRWSPEHADFMNQLDCNVWLLTEVNDSVELDGFERHVSEELMRPCVRWAGVYSRGPLSGLTDPHVASAMAVVDGTTYCSTILPWRSCPEDDTWPGSNHAERTANALAVLVDRLQVDNLVWGGDRNHALSGPEEGGTRSGRRHVLDAIESSVCRSRRRTCRTGSTPSEHRPHRCRRLPQSGRCEPGCSRGLSHHDCYVVDLAVDGLTTD